MPFSESDIESITSQIERLLWAHRRPPLQMRNQIREGQRIEVYTIEIFMSRPKWDEPEKWMEDSVAKIRYVKTSDDWRLYWKRADLKWHAYPEKPRCRSLPEALIEVDADPCGCFWG